MKTRIYNEELTTEIYFMMLYLEHHYKKEMEQENNPIIRRYRTEKDIENTRRRYLLAKDLLSFFREARTTYLDEMPF